MDADPANESEGIHFRVMSRERSVIINNIKVHCTQIEQL